MIIKGDARTGPEVLGPYLTTSEANERIQVFETRGTVATDVVGALKEMDAYAAGSRCQKPLYHVKISPEPPYRLTPEQVTETLDAIEQKFGFAGPRVAVIHEKNGREHIHAVWTRIDPETMKAVSLSFNYRKHEELARDLERRFGHPRVQGVHAERDGEKRPDRSASRNELAQEERTGISRKAVKERTTELFRASDGPKAFREAIENSGYIIAKGDRRDFVLVDHAGGVHSLPKMIEGMRTAELRKFMKPISLDSLPSVELACEAQADRAQGRTSRLDEMRWEDALRTQSVGRDQREANDRREKTERFRADAIKWEAEQKRTQKYETALFRESAIKWEAEQKRRKQEKKELRKAARRARKYSRSADYASQSSVALKDHIRRQRKLNRTPRPQHPSQHSPPPVDDSVRPNEETAHRDNMLQEKANSDHRVSNDAHNNDQRAELDQRADAARMHEDRLRRDAEEQKQRDRTQGPRTSKGAATAREMDDAALARLERYLSNEDLAQSLDEDLEPDRQHEASGRGRTRSR